TQFRNLNLIDVQGKLNTINATLDSSTGAPGTYSFTKLPTLYVGRRSGFDSGRSSVAWTPGLANAFPMGAGENMYFPRQYSFRDAAGNDVFEADTTALIPNARFVEDWDLYHRLDGEIHCGVLMMRDAFSFGWWTV